MYRNLKDTCTADFEIFPGFFFACEDASGP